MNFSNNHFFYQVNLHHEFPMNTWSFRSLHQRCAVVTIDSEEDSMERSGIEAERQRATEHSDPPG